MDSFKKLRASNAKDEEIEIGGGWTTMPSGPFDTKRGQQKVSQLLVGARQVSRYTSHDDDKYVPEGGDDEDPESD